jgi:hypothetical protein
VHSCYLPSAHFYIFEIQDHFIAPWIYINPASYVIPIFLKLSRTGIARNCY